MAKETKKVYTINVKPSIMDKAKIKADKEKRSLSAHVEMLLEKDLSIPLQQQGIKTKEMNEEEIKRMWDIDTKAQMGDKISDEERLWFNERYEKMREEMENNWTHWQFHSGKL